MFRGIYHKQKVLITGHTGFKGSWLTLWLSKLGAEIAAIGLDPCTSPNHWDLLQIPIRDFRTDIRDLNGMRHIVEQFQPTIVFHLAAQPLVRRSYRNPIETFSTNVLGTANLLECCRVTPSVKAIVCITTDKVYENREWAWGYRENDRLGGHDPYSASKACCELVANSYRKAFFEKDGRCLIATVRAGNVIGGGDWSEDRLIPDIVRSVTGDVPLEIRSPNATRPWQHVLESLSGYLMVGEKLMQGLARYATSWNFGPDAEDNRRVAEILESMKKIWPEINFTLTNVDQPHEANLLYLDNSLAKKELAWKPVWTLDETISATSDWYSEQHRSGRVISEQQLEQFVSQAREKGCLWSQS